MKKHYLVLAVLASLSSVPAWAEMDMKAADHPAEKATQPHHDHAVEKGTLPAQHKHKEAPAQELKDKDGKPVARHEHSKDRR